MASGAGDVARPAEFFIKKEQLPERDLGWVLWGAGVEWGEIVLGNSGAEFLVYLLGLIVLVGKPCEKTNTYEE